ncbi:MAG: threonine synthase [Elusimicrobiales bacterium]|nr:threonine synthase [Elusimicrobiales bacterium]
MKKIIMLKCLNCGKEHELLDEIYNCSSCSSNLEVIYDYNLIKKRFKLKELEENRFFDIWRYLDLLPTDDLKGIPLLHVGYTPLYKFKKLADEYDVDMIYIKDDSLNPTLSFKDRATSVVLKRVIDVIDEKKRIVCCASNGNAGSSVACLASSCGIKTVVFVPSKISEPKLLQIFMYGANVVKVEGSYDDAYDVCIEASKNFGWYNINSGYNPFTREGNKTVSFEICEQLEWEIPDLIFVPVGDGNIISGVWKGFLEFKKIGLIDKLPRLVAVQAGSSNAIYNAFLKNTDKIESVSAQTICDNISVKLPKDGLAALISIRESGGLAVNVSDEEVLKSSFELSVKTGIFVEPSAGSVFAAFKKLKFEKKIESNESVLLILTGSGLKDLSIKDKINFKSGIKIKPDIKDLERNIRSILQQN